MQNLEKIKRVKSLCETIVKFVECYESTSNAIYFDYDNVILLLEQTQDLILEAAKCPRPSNIPPDMPWCETMFTEDGNTDLYVFNGDMSVEDYGKIHDNMKLGGQS